MARQTLVVDASVGVKWFSAVAEPHVRQARAILMDLVSGALDLVVPELFFHEIANALVHKTTVSDERLSEALSLLSSLDLILSLSNGTRLVATAQLARRGRISVYDAFYIVLAIENDCPLVTANPRHQRADLGCKVISIEDWRS